MTELFTMVGGMRTLYRGAAFPFNMRNVTWPFARIVVTKDRLSLSAFTKEYEIERNQIDNLEKYRGAFSIGLKITHSKKEMPPGFIFWTFGFAKLKSNLEHFGYKVET
jgi:hypothetical protein